MRFGCAADWTVDNFENRLRFAFEPEGDVVRVIGAEKKCDTAWHLRSRKFPLTKGARGFRLSFEVSCDIAIGGTTAGTGYRNAILWYDAEDRPLGIGTLAFTVGAGEKQGVFASGPVPGGARRAEVQFGFDTPNIIGADRLAYSNFAFETLDWEVKTDGSRMASADTRAPWAHVVSATPTENGAEPLRIRIEDPSGVAWDGVRIWVDGAEMTSAAKRDGDTLVIGRAAGTVWSNGLHLVRCAAADLKGNAWTNRLAFLIGKVPATPKVSVRDDGVTLIDGKPFFPIGIYAVSRREFNGMDFDKAFRDLRKAGFNFAHTYGDSYDPEFLAAARKHDVKLWVQSRTPGAKFVEIGRHHPSIIAWYLGDDTSMNETPEELKNYDDMAKAVDPTRITCQADVVGHGVLQLPYERYLDGTDAIMPEIYPVSGKAGDPSDRTCVARTIDNMRSFVCAAKASSAPRACWPILQYFQGWSSWLHFPSREQLFATSFAAIIHGAKGITWYTYGGFYNKRRDYYDEGITSRPERFRDMADLCTWLQELAPALVERDCPQPTVTVVGGTKTDPVGNPAVSALLKRHGGTAYLITVNSAPSATRARFKLGKFTGSAEVMREGRRVELADGTFEDDYVPLGFHVYRFGN